MAETLFHCDDLLWRRFERLCRERDETPGAVLRDLVRLEVKRMDSRKARRNEVPDERLLVAFGSSSQRRLPFPKAGDSCRQRWASAD